MLKEMLFQKINNSDFKYFKSESAHTNKGQQLRYNKIKSFLNEPSFNGFTSQDLFIMKFIKKGWGHGIAALSNMAEALVNLSFRNPENMTEYKVLMEEVVKRAIHKKVNPYKKDFEYVTDLGKYGYYLEHLNIVLGAYRIISNDETYNKLNKKISYHLLQNSNSYNNFHADLLPHVKMKWSADQSAILYSLWLYDKNNNTDISCDLINNWLLYMKHNATHKKTGLFKTEVLGTRKFSNQPRGCSHSYMVHYMSKFAPSIAKEQWKLYKKYMLENMFGRLAFREYLPDYNGRWSPDSGPIIAGMGVAATGLGLNAASSIGDTKVFKGLEKTMSSVGSVLYGSENMFGDNILSKIGTDLLASSIWLNAETKEDWNF